MINSTHGHTDRQPFITASDLPEIGRFLGEAIAFSAFALGFLFWVIVVV
ncbi:hypothetical protein [Acetobacter malorum]|nr:hypothetical protein [Acetobacter malorum]